MPTTLHDAMWPVVAILVAVAMGGVSRWTFSPTRAQRARREQARERRDFGLLVPVTTLPQREQAELVRDLLARHGIRGTLAVVPPGPVRVTADGYLRGREAGGHQLLVFPSDAERARELVRA